MYVVKSILICGYYYVRHFFLLCRFGKEGTAFYYQFGGERNLEV